MVGRDHDSKYSPARYETRKVSRFVTGRNSFHRNQASFLSPLPKKRIASAVFTTPGPSIPYNSKPRTVIPLVCPTANIWMCPLDVTSLTAHWLEDFPRGPSTHQLQCLQYINTPPNKFLSMIRCVEGRSVNWT
jgi:hypothetical protein